jgi:hypothetical protein
MTSLSSHHEETVRGEPVDANIARRALGSHQDLPEVLKLGSVEVGAVGNRAAMISASRLGSLAEGGLPTPLAPNG